MLHVFLPDGDVKPFKQLLLSNKLNSARIPVI